MSLNDLLDAANIVRDAKTTRAIESIAHIKMIFRLALRVSCAHNEPLTIDTFR